MSAAVPDKGRSTDRPTFDTPNVLWFFGGYAATAAAGVVIGSVHHSARGLWIMLAALAFLAAYSALAWGLLRAGWAIPGGVVAAFAVGFVPVAGGAFERLVGIWPGSNDPQLVRAASPFASFQGRRFILALVTIAAGLVAFSLVRFPFVFFGVALASLIATQLFAPVVSSHQTTTGHATSLVLGGLVLLAIGTLLDLRGERRNAFWWHFFGLLPLAVGLAYHAFRETSWGWTLIFVLGAAILAGAIVLGRATWGVYGVVGVYAPIVHYLTSWFGNLGTALALVVAGLALVGLGMAVRVSGDEIAAVLARRTAPPPPATP